MIRKKLSAPDTSATQSATMAPRPEHTLVWDEIAPAVFAARGLRSGWWRVGIKLRFAALVSRDDATQLVMPTGLVGIDSIVLFSAVTGGDMVYDAATGKPVPEGASMADAKSVQPVRKVRASRSR